MESPPLAELLMQIGRATSDLAERRGPHAAALWAVSDFFTGLGGRLVPCLDSEELAGTAGRLALQPLPGRSDQWGLCVVCGEDVGAASSAPPAVQVAAVRRLPDFLALVLKQLQGAAGSKRSLQLAEQVVNMVGQQVQAGQSDAARDESCASDPPLPAV